MSHTPPAILQPQTSPTGASPTHAQHLHYLRQTIPLATASPCLPTNFRVGCVLVSYPIPSSTSSTTTSPQVLSTGYTLELAGNTHAEQCALSKLAQTHSVPNADPSLSTILTPSANVTLYTSLEPCGKRLSGNLPCVQRIIATRQQTSSGTQGGEGRGGIRKVIFGAKEPGTFVTDSQSCRLLTEAGIEWEYIPDLEEEILRVAMEGHTKATKAEEKQGDVAATTDSAAGGSESQGSNAASSTTGQEVKETWHPDVGEGERQARESAPRNPKKRMMEVQL